MSATTVPDGVALAWTSSNEAIATVDDAGLVSGVAAGDAIITASFEYEGKTYSDTCAVTVEDAPTPPGDWETVVDLLSPVVWENGELWESQQYVETSRQTYIEFIRDSNILNCVYDPDGSSTTLYFDLKPLLATVGELDFSNYDYRLFTHLSADFTAELSTPATVLILSTGADANAAKLTESHTIVISPDTVEDLALPLMLNNVQGTRLMTLQCRALEKPVISGGQMYFVFYLENLYLERKAKQ